MYKLDPRCVYDNNYNVTCLGSSVIMVFGLGKHFDKPRKLAGCGKAAVCYSGQNSLRRPREWTGLSYNRRV